MYLQSKRKISIAIVAPGLAAYRIPLLNYLNSLPDLQITALLSKAPEDTQESPNNLQAWNFPYLVFRSASFAFDSHLGDRSRLPFSPALFAHLAHTPYDAVIALGWTMPNTFYAWLQRKLTRRPMVLWDESILHPPGNIKRRAMPLVKRYVGSFESCLGASSAALDYFVAMGAARERVVLFPQVTDNEFFAGETSIWRQQRQTLKEALGIRTKQVILFVGRFIRVKGLPTLLEAFEQVALENADVSLLLVGQGPMQTQLEAQRATLAARDRIVIHPFAAQQDLPKFYALADLFVLPSFSETFGVVINEAMASGLPIVTTTRVGAVADLVREGENGRVVPAGDTNALAQALVQILNDDALRQRMGACSAERIATWNIELAVKGLFQCLDLCRVTRR